MATDHRQARAKQRANVVRKPEDSFDWQSSQLQITEFLQYSIPGVEFARIIGSELVFRVPHGCEDRLPSILSMLELQSQSLGICVFGVKSSSLEDVFLSLSDESLKGDELAHDTPSLSIFDECSYASSLTEKVVVEPSPSSFLQPILNKTLRTDSLTWIEQVEILYWKRFIIQKGDFKGLLFSVFVPTLAVALVLLTLSVDTSHVAPAIEMSPLALGSKMNDVFVGGGAAFRYRLTAKRDIAREVDSLQSLMEPLYKNTGLFHVANMKSSSNISDFLLESYGNVGGNDRYGSFVLNDALTLNAAVDWTLYKSDLQQAFNNTLRIFSAVTVDLASIPTILGVDGILDFTASVRSPS